MERPARADDGAAIVADHERHVTRRGQPGAEPLVHQGPDDPRPRLAPDRGDRVMGQVEQHRRNFDACRFPLTSFDYGV